MPPHDGSVATGGYLPFDLVLASADKQQQQQHQEQLRHDEEVEEKGEQQQQQQRQAEEEEESVAEPAADAATAEPQQQQEQEQPAVGVDDFAPVRAVGNGDMGTVFLVAHKSTRTAYAMKVMKKEVLRQRDTFFRADLERDVLASLDHPFLPSLYAHFETPTHRFLVMNYCAGGDLNVLRQVQPEKRFSEAAARFYASEVVLALDYLHSKGIIYRDLKPENILVKEDGHIMLADFDLSARMTGDKYVTRAVVMDAKRPQPQKRTTTKGKSKSKAGGVGGGGGLAKMFSCAAPVERLKTNGVNVARVTPLEILSSRETRLARSHSFVGTEEYVAPEMVWGTGHGKAVDWWALGILLYEMVCGKTPFKGDNRKSTFVNIMCRDVMFPGPWSPLKDLVEKLLNKDPTKRLGSVSGADEVRNHCFFEGVQWDAIQYVSRPPHVPAPFSLEEEEERRRKRLEAAAAAAEGSGDNASRRSSSSSSRSNVHGSRQVQSSKKSPTADDESWTSSPVKSSEDQQFFDLPASAFRPSSRDDDRTQALDASTFDDTF